MAASSKITNNLFVWGNVTTNESDLGTIETSTVSDVTIAPGEKAGNFLFASLYNSVGRAGSLISYSLIDALRYGPYGQQSGEELDKTSLDYNNSWDSTLSQMEFNYTIASNDIPTLINNLRNVLNTYLKYSQTRLSLQANCWSTPRLFQIADANERNLGGTTSIDGGPTNYDTDDGYLLHLPGTIEADLSGVASNVETTNNTNTEIMITGVASTDTSKLLRVPGITAQSATLTLDSQGGNPTVLFKTPGDNGVISIYGTNDETALDFTCGNYSARVNDDGFIISDSLLHAEDYIKISAGSTTIDGLKSTIITSQYRGSGAQLAPSRYFSFSHPSRFGNPVVIANRLNFSSTNITSNISYYIDKNGSGVLNTLQLNQLGNANTTLNAYFGNNSTILDGTCTMQTFSALSDRRLKENIKTFEPHKSILDLDVVEFDYKDSKKHSIGCIAQELQEICPEIVNENKDGYLSIEENKLVYLLLDEVKKLRKELDELKGK